MLGLDLEEHVPSPAVAACTTATIRDLAGAGGSCSAASHAAPLGIMGGRDDHARERSDSRSAPRRTARRRVVPALRATARPGCTGCRVRRCRAGPAARRAPHRDPCRRGRGPRASHVRRGDRERGPVASGTWAVPMARRHLHQPGAAAASGRRARARPGAIAAAQRTGHGRARRTRRDRCDHRPRG